MLARMKTSLLGALVVVAGLSIAGCGSGSGEPVRQDGSLDVAKADARVQSDVGQTGGGGGAGGAGTGGMTARGGSGGGGTGGGSTGGSGGSTALDAAEEAGKPVDAPGVDIAPLEVCGVDVWGAEAGALDTGADVGGCSGQSPALASCLTSQDHCVPSSCICQEGRWTCTADCRISLPRCDAGAAIDSPGREVSSGCSVNSDCPAGQVCFRGPSSTGCLPESQMCTSREPNFNRCMCPGCTCGGSSAPASFWGCVT